VSSNDLLDSLIETRCMFCGTISTFNGFIRIRDRFQKIVVLDVIIKSHVYSVEHTMWSLYHYY